MTDNANSKGNAHDDKNPKKKVKTLIIIAVLVLALAAASFFAYAYFTKTFIFNEDSKVAPVAEVVYPLGEFVINLNDSKNRSYLKTQIAVGYANKKDEIFIKDKKFQIRDIIIQTLRSKTAEDIRAVEKTDELKVEIMNKLNELFEPELILEVYIVDILIQ